jgi:hypothetical protein
MRTKQILSPGEEKLEAMINKWHREYDGDKALHVFLGITWAEYAEYIQDCKLPAKYQI